MKKPRYIWLSLIGFCILSYQVRTKILGNGQKIDYNLWLRYVRTEIIWGSVTLFVPGAIIILLIHIAYEYNYLLGVVINILGLICIYFGGVILTTRLYDWKVSNVDNK